MEMNTVLVRRENLRTRLCTPPPQKKTEKDSAPSTPTRTAGSTGKLITLSIILFVILVVLAYLVRRWHLQNVRVGRSNRFFDCLVSIALGKRDEVMEGGVVEGATSAAEGVGYMADVADETVGDAADVIFDAHDAVDEIEEVHNDSIMEYVVKLKIVVGLYQIIGSMKWSLPSIAFPKLLQAPLSIGNLVQCGVRF